MSSWARKDNAPTPSGWDHGPADSAGSTAGRRRELAIAVLLCAAGAGLALYAASRTWLVETVTRPAPLGPVSTSRSGTELIPALAAVSLVVLAGAGALLAARGWGRRPVGALILAGGLAAAGLALSALGRTEIALGWVGATVTGGLVAAGTGAFALVRGAAWPSLGARYERPSPAAGRPGADDRTGADHRTVGADDRTGADHRTVGADDRTDGSDLVAEGSADRISREYWDALDRGDDPTDPPKS